MKLKIRATLESLFGNCEQDNKTSPNEVKLKADSPGTAHIGDAEYYKAFLLDIYKCKKTFDLVVVHTKPKTRMGTYAPRFARIRINDGWGGIDRCKEIAIHEYAHHIHFTEKEKTKRKEDPHGKQFWQIYGQLILLAKQKGLFNHPETLDL